MPSSTAARRPTRPAGLVEAFVAAVILALLVIADLVLTLVRESDWVYVAAVAVATVVAVGLAAALLVAVRKRRW